MDIETFNKANEIYNKIKGIESDIANMHTFSAYIAENNYETTIEVKLHDSPPVRDQNGLFSRFMLGQMSVISGIIKDTSVLQMLGVLIADKEDDKKELLNQLKQMGIK